MNEVTQILNAMEQGDPKVAEQLLPLVYDELRKLAAQKMSKEKPGQTLQATALVHEAYVRLVGGGPETKWQNRRYFFAAAGEAMRRILVERARAKQRDKRGGNLIRLDVNDVNPGDDSNHELVLGVHEALEHLASEDEELAALVKLRCFAGYSVPEAADALGIGHSTAYEHWSYAKSRLRMLLDDPASA